MDISFGNYIRALRKEKNMTQRELAEKVGINFTYLSKIENGKLKEVQFPSEETIIKLAKSLKADKDELLLLANKVPENIKNRVIEQPEVFRKFAKLSDSKLKEILKQLEKDDK